MSRVKLKNNKKLNKTNLKKTCNHIPQVKRLDLEQQQAEWEEVKWAGQECQLQVHRQNNKVEELTGQR